jgi:hypothetical protein
MGPTYALTGTVTSTSGAQLLSAQNPAPAYYVSQAVFQFGQISGNGAIGYGTFYFTAPNGATTASFQMVLTDGPNNYGTLQINVNL